MSYASRTGAVLFAGDVDRVAAFYAAVLGLEVEDRQDDHILLESKGFQLVVHRAMADAPVTDHHGNAPVRRAAAGFKPVFFVPSLSRLRAVAEANGGVIESKETEWSFHGVAVCDGVDPEGNVLQFRQLAG
jgi:catechol 2,3-dioxygenase-like lactoylglutathione lyase family enzyme